jgi:hypothetical protein
VADAMIPAGEAPVLGADRPLGDALTELAESPVGRALVCPGDRLDGMVWITDVARVLDVLSGTGRARPAAPVDAGSVAPEATAMGRGGR